MSNLSICLIAKNEENCIEKCLTSLIPFQEAGAEIVVVDTGSSDRTKVIAAKYTDRIYDFIWCDDFSAARNYAAKVAHHELILFIDCDETIVKPQSRSEVHAFLASLDQLSPEYAGMLTRTSPTLHSGTATDEIARIYHKNTYHYKGIIHEQLFPLDGTNPQYRLFPMHMDHSGYTDEDLMQQKANRNIALLEKDLAKNPEDDYTLFQLAQSYRALGQYDKALGFLEKAIELDLNPELDYVKTLVESYGYTLIDLDRAGEALSLYGVYDTFCTRADFVFMLGVANMQTGQIEQAITEFKKAVTISSHCIEGTNSYSAYYNLGVIYECMGDAKTAKTYYQKCGDYESAKIRLSALS